MYSETLQKIIKNKKGYRTENFSGSGVRKLSEVVEFEIYELGNTDIIDFVQTHYGLLESFKTELMEDLSYMQKNIHKIVETITNYCLSYFSVTDIDKLETIWLTDYENTKSFYNYGEEDGIHEYSLNIKFLILSDLDEQGALFVLKAPCESREVF